MPGLIDYVGSTRIGIRRTPSSDANFVTITRLAGSEWLRLTPEEWLDLCGLITSIVASVDFWDTYASQG